MTAARGNRMRAGSIPLVLFWICAGLYVLDVVLGKIGAVVGGFSSPLHLGDVAQFLLLMATSVFLVMAALVREARLKKENNQ